MKDEALHINARKFRGETEIVSARLPKDLVRELARIAHETGRSRNEIIEMCLTFAIERVQTDTNSEEK